MIRVKDVEEIPGRCSEPRCSEGRDGGEESILPCTGLVVRDPSPVREVGEKGTYSVVYAQCLSCNQRYRSSVRLQ